MLNGLNGDECCEWCEWRAICPFFWIKKPLSPQRNIRWTQNQSVNSSLSIVVQQKKNSALYLSWFSRGGQTKYESTFLQKAKLSFQIFLWIFVKIIENQTFQTIEGHQNETEARRELTKCFPTKPNLQTIGSSFIKSFDV